MSTGGCLTESKRRGDETTKLRRGYSTISSGIALAVPNGRQRNARRQLLEREWYQRLMKKAAETSPECQ
ncbi:hypothetical protein PC116_g19318 [Phytophthora cactorum]|uniref:Uncharacterized protein n=1 Tax=Phytophthora cactorum TaxID=29920 RepID=A0A8T1KBB8_9STRA|nr:hypothetical protein Pcac1_g12119 [Phytophthora cactorum]KAG2908813.1 hypothetical protein PC114_g10285 [Phytophthora cactorum]KAG2950482.1 hypothetical protein PC117_g4406 [Phytophthora cactorum]KAG3002494.1 hypothetical protein PC119_g16293 [Phytophthora cactorum]KAG3186258.1 hypothetical protein C6341_g3930 [Phytophthora cactorum]